MTNIYLDRLLQDLNGVMVGNIPDGAYIHNKQQLGLHPKNFKFKKNLERNCKLMFVSVKTIRQLLGLGSPREAVGGSSVCYIC